jgi:hypothetical protein
MLTHDTCTRGYTNVPPYETAPAVKVRATARYGFATRPAGTAPAVTHAYASIHEARRQRENARRRNEWVSHVLERVGTREWVPVGPKFRTMYAIPEHATA